MLSSVLLVPALAASVFAAPTFPSINTDAALPGSITVMSDYFNMLADKVQQSRLMSDVAVCDLSKAAVPTRMSPFHFPPPPAAAQGISSHFTDSLGSPHAWRRSEP